MGETPSVVFEALLAKWVASEATVRGGVVPALQAERDEWRERFDRAEELFVQALTG